MQKKKFEIDWEIFSQIKKIFLLFFSSFIFFNFEKKTLWWHAFTGHIRLHSENLPRATKTGSSST